MLKLAPPCDRVSIALRDFKAEPVSQFSNPDENLRTTRGNMVMQWKRCFSPFAIVQFRAMTVRETSELQSPVREPSDGEGLTRNGRILDTDDFAIHACEMTR